MQETRVQSLGGEYSLEKEMATHLGILVWRIPWAEEPGGLQSTWSQRVDQDLVTKPLPPGSIHLCQGVHIDDPSIVWFSAPNFLVK